MILKFLAVLSFGLFSLQAYAATTGLDFAGGCPSGSDATALCGMGSNATEANVAAILGLDVSLVNYIGEDTGSGGPGFAADLGGSPQTMGNWTVTDMSITHLAFKADTYFILAEVQAPNGTYDMTDIGDGAGFNLLLATCPAAICNTGPRAYTISDFQNLGGQFSDLSNVRAFSVVPVPAAVWLFGSGLLGLVGIARRKRA